MVPEQSFYGNYDDIEQKQIEKRYAEFVEIFNRMLVAYQLEASYRGMSTHNIVDYVKLDSTRLFHAVCQYFNDVKRTKSTQNIDKINFVKIVSYSIKWLLVNSPIYIDNNDRFALDLIPNDKLQTFFLNPNITFAYFVFLDFFPFLLDWEPRKDDKEGKLLAQFNQMVEQELRYLSSLGHYDVHTAQSFFNTVRYFCYSYFGYERLHLLIGDQ